jgi:outer membrane protein TolC
VGFLSEAVKTAEESQKNEDNKTTIKPHDLYRLKTALDDLEQKKLFAKQGKQTAEKAVVWVSGSQFSNVDAVPFVPETFEKKTLEEYLVLAKANRPELRAIAAGKTARQALASAKQAQDFPTLFVGGFVSGGWSPVRDRQPSMYAFDPFNRINGGGGLGLRLDLEFARHSAEAAEERAEAMKLEATESYAVPGIELQVKRAFWELEQAVDGYEIAKRRRDLGKKWFVSNAMGWSIGVTPPKDLLEALEGNGLARKNYIETVYAYNVALAKLSQAVGKEITALDYK